MIASPETLSVLLEEDFEWLTLRNDQGLVVGSASTPHKLVVHVTGEGWVSPSVERGRWCGDDVVVGHANWRQ